MRVAAAQGVGDLGEQFAQECDRGFAVVDVAGAVLDPQQVARDVRRDWVVARHLAVMRIESAKRALHREAGGQDRSVEIHGQAPQRSQHAEGARHDRGVQRPEAPNPRAGELVQPPAQGHPTRQASQSAEAMDQRIADQIGHVTQPPPADDQQDQHDPHHRRDAKVARQSREMLADQPVEIDPSKVPDQQLESGVRGEARLGELDPQFTVDPAAQIGFPSPHRSWPFVGVRGTVRTALSNHNERPFFNHEIRNRSPF